MTRFALDPSSKKYVCPQCGRKRFVRYINVDTKSYIDARYGRCDREVACAYHLHPKGKEWHIVRQAATQKPPYYIPEELYRQSLGNYHNNHLVTFLKSLFSAEKVWELIQLYRLGTSKKWEGASLYWQINHKGQIGQGKIMLHDPQSGKRVKHPYPHVSSVHKLLNRQNEKPELCYFGEHLLTLYPGKTVALVESEKTAIILAGINPSVIWVASGSLSNLNSKRLAPFKNRRIILYPDLGAFQKWQQQADELRQMGFHISVSDLLEKKASPDDRQEGFDLADYFIKQRIISRNNNETAPLQTMKTKNSALQLFIDAFGLVERPH